MKLVLFLTFIWCGAVVIAACACASRSDKSIRNMRQSGRGGRPFTLPPVDLNTGYSRPTVNLPIDRHDLTVNRNKQNETTATE